MATSVITPTWIESIEHSYQQDTHCQEILQKLLISPDSEKDYNVTAGIIRYKGKILVGNNADLKTKLIQALHSSPIRGQS